jgi:hypothetical protein
MYDIAQALPAAPKPDNVSPVIKSAFSATGLEIAQYVAPLANVTKTPIANNRVRRSLSCELLNVYSCLGLV